MQSALRWSLPRVSDDACSADCGQSPNPKRAVARPAKGLTIHELDPPFVRAVVRRKLGGMFPRQSGADVHRFHPERSPPVRIVRHLEDANAGARRDRCSGRPWPRRQFQAVEHTRNLAEISEAQRIAGYGSERRGESAGRPRFCQ